MAAPAPARRRITPQLVQSPSASQQEATGFGGPSAARSVPPAVAPAQPTVVSKAGAGRRFYVDINASNTVNWRELLKQRGVGKKRAAQQPAAGLPGAPGLPGLGAQEPLAPAARPKKARGNVYESILQKLERTYMIADSSEDEDANSDTPNDDDGEAADSDGSEDEEEEALNEGFVAYEDDFVDDSEIMQYKGGIKDKARHTGFYLNAGGIEKDERGLEGSDAEPKDDAVPKPKKRKKPAAADKPGSEADGVQGTDGAAAAKPKAAGKKAATGVQGGEGSGAEGAAKPKAPRKRKAADEGEGPAKKLIKQAKHKEGPPDGTAATAGAGAGAASPGAPLSLAARALQAAKAGFNKPKPSAGSAGQAGALPASPSTAAASPAPKAQQQQPPIGSPGVPASVAEEAALQAARRAASNGAAKPMAQPTAQQQQQQPAGTSNSLPPPQKAAGTDFGGSGAAAAAPKAKKSGNGVAAGGGAAEQFAGPMPAGTEAAMMRFQDAVAGANKGGTTAPKAVKQALEALASQVHKDAKSAPGLKAAVVEAVAPLMEGWMSAKVVRRRLTDDLDKQEAALEGQGGLLEMLCASLAAMAQEMWREAGSDGDFQESPRSRWSAAVEDELAAAWEAHTAVHGSGEMHRLVERLAAAVPDHPLTEPELQAAYQRAKKRRTAAKAALRRPAHGTQAGPASTQQAGPASQATPQATPSATPQPTPHTTPQHAVRQPSQQLPPQQGAPQQQQQQQLVQQTLQALADAQSASQQGQPSTAPAALLSQQLSQQPLEARLKLIQDQVMQQPQLASNPAQLLVIAAALGLSHEQLAQALASVIPANQGASTSQAAAGTAVSDAAAASAAPAAPAVANGAATGAAATAAAVPSEQQLPSVEECAAAAVAAGADSAVLTEDLKEVRPGTNLQHVVRILCLAGPEGLSLKDVVARGVAGGVAGWENDEKRRKALYNAVAASDAVVFIGNKKYALKAFPGVEAAKPKAPKEGPSSTGAEGVAAD